MQQSPRGTLQPLKNNTDAASVLFLIGCKVPQGDCSMKHSVFGNLVQE